MSNDNQAGPSGGIQSLDAALQLLATLAKQRGPVSLSELARISGMPPSKAHRYLASFQAAGLVEQGGRLGKYDLGPGAVQLGLSAISRLDFVNRAADRLPELRDETGLTALLSVWGSQGATVVRWERAMAPMVTSMGLGTTLPLLNSATGRAFLAWASPKPLSVMLELELQQAKRQPKSLPDIAPNQLGVRALVQTIRERGYASVDGKFIPGLVAIAAPILDWQGEAQAIISLIGTDPALLEPGSDSTRQLVAYCDALSHRDPS